MTIIKAIPVNMTDIVASSATPASMSGTPAALDPTRLERSLPIGSDSRCQCVGCGRYFSGARAFEAHQRLTRDGDVLCLDPASVGLRIIHSGGFAWWSRAAPRLVGNNEETT
ncbi:MAG: hypothetical protein ACRDJW_04610 [Thermomicrobiales bacterium]